MAGCEVSGLPVSWGSAHLLNEKGSKVKALLVGHFRLKFGIIRGYGRP